ncbi:hypothetical protein Scep_016295 [Stephania cephalantha]|uniref:Uncharacterized protein n=1 Tax=Stephania cephalantha TaxID=152367 RepID=A0AAP0IPA4_9MAGN
MVRLTFASLDSLKNRAWIDFRSVNTLLLLFPTKMSELIFTTIVNLLTPTSSLGLPELKLTLHL